MIKIRFKKNLRQSNQPVYLAGEIYEMSRNEAFAFIESGYAEVAKGLDNPPADKQIRRGRKKSNVKIK